VQGEGFPTLGTERLAEWSGRSAAEVCTSEALKIGVPLGRARDGVPQEGLVTSLCAKRLTVCFGEGVAGRNGPQRRVPERRQLHRRLEAGRKHPPSTWPMGSRPYSFSALTIRGKVGGRIVRCEKRAARCTGRSHDKASATRCCPTFLYLWPANLPAELLYS
jgi:hypothetical protein